MARLKVVKRFKDKTTGEYRVPGETFTVTKQRAEELAAAGVAVILQSRKPDRPPEDKTVKPEENKGAG